MSDMKEKSNTSNIVLIDLIDRKRDGRRAQMMKGMIAFLPRG